MILVRDLYLQFGEKIIFDGIQVALKPEDKVGLIGLNGAGKTSLFRVISGELKPDSGHVEFTPNVKLAYLKQHLDIGSNKTIFDEAMSRVENSHDLQKKIDSIQEQIDKAKNIESEKYLNLFDKLAILHEKINSFESQRGKAEVILKGLGFLQEDLERPVYSFSGGWQMRVELAKVLIQEPNYLLLDEPSNYLDIESVLWFEQYLKSFSGAFMVISHDQDFLDNCTQKTFELAEGKLFVYNANYSGTMSDRQLRIDNQLSAFANQQKLIQSKQRTIDRFRAKASKRNMVKSMEKQLAKLDRVEVDQDHSKDIQIRFNEAPRTGEVVIESIGLSKSFGENKVFDKVDLKLLRGQKIALVGKNGEGKSTLVNIFSGKISQSKGDWKLGYNVCPGYYFQDHPEKLEGNLTVYETLEEIAPAELRPRLRAILGAFLFSGEEIDKKVRILSGGEKSRLALASLLMEPFNFLILDEPTNHLDIPSKKILKSALKAFNGSLLIVSHDRSFLRDLTTETYEISSGNIHQHLGGIDEFLENKNLSSFREFELNHSNQASDKGENDIKTSPSKVKPGSKKSKNRLRALEKLIEDGENYLVRSEARMIDPEFYNSLGYMEDLKKHNEQKKRLKDYYEEWDILVSEMYGGAEPK